MSDNTGKRITQCKTHRKRSKGQGNQCRIKQGNGLHRRRIKQGLLYLHTCISDYFGKCEFHSSS